METSIVFGTNFLNDISEMTEYIFCCMVTWCEVGVCVCGGGNGMIINFRKWLFKSSHMQMASQFTHNFRASSPLTQGNFPLISVPQSSTMSNLP